MVLSDVIAGAFLVVALAAAIAYMVRAKKRGVKCIGCSEGGSCASKQGASAGAASGECCCSAADKMVADMEQRLK